MISNVDRTLTEQLANAEKSNSKLQAWFRLTAPDIDISKDPPEKIQAIAQSVIERVKQQAKEEPDTVNIQPFLGTFTVYAHPAFLKTLLKQPEIGQAGAAHVPGFGLIKPVNSKSAFSVAVLAKPRPFVKHRVAPSKTKR